MNQNDLPYRLGVGIILLNSSNKIFVGKRIDRVSESWQMPQGGIDDGEDVTAAMFRELWEETSVKTVEILQESKDWYYYDLPKELVGKVLKGKYKGQKQKWFVLKFLGDESEININTEDPEFLEYKWLEPKEIVDYIVPFKKELYQNLLNEFGELFQ